MESGRFAPVLKLSVSRYSTEEERESTYAELS